MKAPAFLNIVCKSSDQFCCIWINDTCCLMHTASALIMSCPLYLRRVRSTCDQRITFPPTTIINPVSPLTFHHSSNPRCSPLIMPKEPTSSKLRRTARDVQQEIALGLQHLDLSNDIDPGHVVAVGGYADVFCGTLVVKKTNQSVKVAAKKIKCMLEKEKVYAKVRDRPLID